MRKEYFLYWLTKEVIYLDSSEPWLVMRNVEPGP